MAVKTSPKKPSAPTRKGLVSPSVVRTMVRRIVRHFHPERIILFGSYAYGEPDADSDVDVLVVMAARNETDQAVRIRKVVDPHFALDIIVRTPRNLAWRLEEGDWFLREVVGKGKVLYRRPERGVTLFQRRRASRHVGRRLAGQHIGERSSAKRMT